MEDKRGQGPGERLPDEIPPIPGGSPPTSRKKRILALIGAILVVILTLVYTYSLATGAFLKW